MQKYEGGKNSGNDASGEDNRTKAPKILHKSSKELYRAVAKQCGITCKMSDHCRCLDCQVSSLFNPLTLGCDIEYTSIPAFQRSGRHFAAFSKPGLCVHGSPPSFNFYVSILALPPFPRRRQHRKIKRTKDDSFVSPSNL